MYNWKERVLLAMEDFTSKSPLHLSIGLRDRRDLEVKCIEINLIVCLLQGFEYKYH